MNSTSIMLRVASGWFWLGFIILWLIWGSMTSRKRPVVARGQRGERVVWWVVLIVLLILYGFSNARLYLALDLWPGSLQAAEAGLLLELLGLGLAIWARLRLGAFWSRYAVVRQGHRVVDTGPYRLVRHPIYSGILLAMVGTFIMAGAVVWLLILAGYTIFVVKKALNEERLLTRELGDEYVRYRSRTSMLIPWLL